MKNSTETSGIGSDGNGLHSKPPINTKAGETSNSDVTNVQKTNVSQQHMTSTNAEPRGTTHTPAPSNSNLSISKDRTVSVEVKSNHHEFSTKKENSYSDLYKNLKKRK